MTELLAVTQQGLVHLADDGDDWTARLLRRTQGMRTVAVHPADRNLVFAGGRKTGLHRSEDGGETWTVVELPERDVFSLAVSPADGAVYAGTEPSRLFRSRDRGKHFVEISALQDIPSRSEWSFPPRPYTSHVRWIAPHPVDPGLLLVGIELGGVMRTTDGGATFADHPGGAIADVHALAWHGRDTDRAYEAGGGGSAWTRDRGATWTRIDEGRSHDYCWGLAVHPTEPDRWFVSAAASASRAHGSRSSDAAIYRSWNAGPWERVGAGLPDPLDAFPYALLMTEHALFVGLGDGRIFMSRDEGDRFAEITLPEDARDGLVGLRHLAIW